MFLKPYIIWDPGLVSPSYYPGLPLYLHHIIWDPGLLTPYIIWDPGLPSYLTGYDTSNLNPLLFDAVLHVLEMYPKSRDIQMIAVWVRGLQLLTGVEGRSPLRGLKT